MGVGEEDEVAVQVPPTVGWPEHGVERTYSELTSGSRLASGGPVDGREVPRRGDGLDWR